MSCCCSIFTLGATVGALFSRYSLILNFESVQSGSLVPLVELVSAVASGWDVIPAYFVILVCPQRHGGWARARNGSSQVAGYLVLPCCCIFLAREGLKAGSK
jgi:hypothetical protein